MGVPIHKQKNWKTNTLANRKNDINRNGAPKKIYTQIRNLGYGISDLKACFSELVWENREEIEKLANDASKPIIVTIVAKSCLNAVNSGDFARVKEIVEYVIGKPKQQIELDANVTEDKQELDLSIFRDETIAMMMEDMKVHEAKEAKKM